MRNDAWVVLPCRDTARAEVKMKKRLIAIASALSLVIMLSHAQQLHAQALPNYEETYDVYDICTAGPCLPTTLVGHWFLACDGSFTGWGSQPGTYATDTVVTQGAFCSSPGPDDRG